MTLQPLIRLTTDRCIVCEHPISGVTRAALDQAREDHTSYVNTQLPKATDPHFAAARLEALIA